MQDSLNKGYDLYSIRNNLIKQYPQQEVDEVVNIFLKQQQDFQLRNYVNKQLSLGFRPELIRNTLLQRGYTKEQVDPILGNNITVRHEIHFPTKTIIIILLLLIAAGAGYWFFNPGEALLDVSITSNNLEYLAGQEVTYSIELTNMGKSNRIDATIRYVITDYSDKVLKSSSETLAVETKATSNGKIVLPSNLAPGTYYLKASVTYGKEQKAESSVDFQIVEQIRPGGGTIQPQPTETTTQPKTNTGTTTTTRAKSFGESMQTIRQQAATNPQTAITNCLKFSNQEHKDVCISEIAYGTNKANYCEQIINTNVKDNCYLAFVIKGNTEICPKITDNSFKQYCEQIRIVDQMNYYMQRNETDKVLELTNQFNPPIYYSNPVPNTYTEKYNEPASIEDFIIKAELNTT